MDDAGVPDRILMHQRALHPPRDDFRVAVRMRLESLPGGDDVVDETDAARPRCRGEILARRPDGGLQRLLVGPRGRHDLQGDDRPGHRVGTPVDPCHVDAGHRRHPLLDRQGVHLDAADVDDLATAAATTDQMAVGCEMSTIVMCSEAHGYHGGQLQWSVTHDPDDEAHPLAVEGTPPAILADLESKALKAQAQQEIFWDFYWKHPGKLVTHYLWPKALRYTGMELAGRALRKALKICM